LNSYTFVWSGTFIAETDCWANPTNMLLRCQRVAEKEGRAPVAECVHCACEKFYGDTHMSLQFLTALLPLFVHPSTHRPSRQHLNNTGNHSLTPSSVYCQTKKTAPGKSEWERERVVSCVVKMLAAGSVCWWVYEQRKESSEELEWHMGVPTIPYGLRQSYDQTCKVVLINHAMKMNVVAEMQHEYSGCQKQISEGEGNVRRSW